MMHWRFYTQIQRLSREPLLGDPLPPCSTIRTLTSLCIASLHPALRSCLTIRTLEGVEEMRLTASPCTCVMTVRASSAQELVRSHDIEVDTATSFAEFDAAVRGIDSEPAAEVPEWNRYGLCPLWSDLNALHPGSGRCWVHVRSATVQTNFASASNTAPCKHCLGSGQACTTS